MLSTCSDCMLFEHRKEVVKLFEEIHGHIYHANLTWLTFQHQYASSCEVLQSMGWLKHQISLSLDIFSHIRSLNVVAWGPILVKRHLMLQVLRWTCKFRLLLESYISALLGWTVKNFQPQKKKNEDDIRKNDPFSSGLFFQRSGSYDVGEEDINFKEESQFEDQVEDAGDWQRELIYFVQVPQFSTTIVMCTYIYFLLLIRSKQEFLEFLLGTELQGSLTPVLKLHWLRPVIGSSLTGRWIM